MMSPVGPYFKSGFVPIKLAVDSKWIRAWPGGTGNVKFGGNYSPTVMAQRDTAEFGASQALFVYDKEQYMHRSWYDEYFSVVEKQNGGKRAHHTDLRRWNYFGITRQWVIDLAREWGECKVTERMLPSCRKCSTRSIERKFMRFLVRDGGISNLSHQYRIKRASGFPLKTAFSKKTQLARMTNTLIGIQYGEIEHPWSRVVA